MEVVPTEMIQQNKKKQQTADEKGRTDEQLEALPKHLIKR